MMPDTARDADVEDEAVLVDQVVDTISDVGIDAAMDTAPDTAPDIAPDISPDIPDDVLAPDTSPSCVHPPVVRQCQDGFCTIPAGCFLMGSPTSEPCRSSYEPQHPVTLTHAFQIQATEVTQSQFEALMGYNPSDYKGCGASCPVEQVSWHEAVAYCNALSTQKSLATCYDCTGSGDTVACAVKTAYAGGSYYTCPGYRLPTDAEWEYAYRAGTTTAFYNGEIGAGSCYLTSFVDATMDQIAWYHDNSDASYGGCYAYGSRCLGTHPVAQKLPNGWGLHDMSGNVWEWIYDWWESYPAGGPIDPAGAGAGTTRGKRGGSWFAGPQLARAATRLGDAPTYRIGTLGFRCAKTL